jgi:hypothetical protein
LRSPTTAASRSRSAALTSIAIPSRMPHHRTDPALVESYDCVRPLEAYADVLQGCQVVHNEASRLFLNIPDDYSAQLRLVHEKVLQLYHILNRTRLLATPEMRDTCEELSDIFGRIALKAGERPQEMSIDEFRALSGDEAGALVARFSAQAENDLAVGSRMKPKLHALWRHLLTRSR